MQLVASYVTLREVDENDFRNWLKTLSVKLTEKNVEFLLYRSNYRKACIWMKYGGFKFV